MTINEAIKRIKDRSHRGDPAVTTDDTTAVMLRALSDGVREVGKRIPKDFLRTQGSISAVNGTSTYSLASDVMEPILFRYTSNSADYQLDRVPSEQEFYNGLYSSTIANSRPRYYLELGADGSNYKQVLLYPTPDASYTIYYPYYRNILPSDYTTSDLASEIAYIPKHLHDAVWKQGLYEFLKGFDDPAQARAKMDADSAMMDVDQADDKDLDSGPSFRFDTGRGNFRGDITGIRIV